MEVPGESNPDYILARTLNPKDCSIDKLSSATHVELDSFWCPMKRNFKSWFLPICFPKLTEYYFTNITFYSTEGMGGSGLTKFYAVKRSYLEIYMECLKESGGK